MTSVLPLQRRFDNFEDVFRPAVHAGLLARFGIELEAELGGDTTRLRNGASASPTSVSFVYGP
jgi:hypothetical protein